MKMKINKQIKIVNSFFKKTISFGHVEFHVNKYLKMYKYQW